MFRYGGNQLVEERYTFDSLDELPKGIAAPIPEKGGTEGEVIV